MSTPSFEEIWNHLRQYPKSVVIGLILGLPIGYFFGQKEPEQTKATLNLIIAERDKARNDLAAMVKGSDVALANERNSRTSKERDYESRISELTEKLATSDADVKRLTDETAKLANDGKRKSAIVEPVSLDENGNKFILLLFQTGVPTSENDIARAFGWSRSLARLYLDRAIKARLVEIERGTFGSSTRWVLTSAGREYAVAHGK